MKTFKKIGVNKNIDKGLSELGFEAPTPIQEKVIPMLLEGQGDLISLAQTGTGKTAAFGVPLVQLTNSGSNKTQALVLCPTRELCVQVARDLKSFARHVLNVRILAVYGGAPIASQIVSLDKGAHIIVATPGRLHDLMRRGSANISSINTVVLDEADEMLNMGFQEEINAILDKTPDDKSTLLFSATMSKDVASIASRYMKNPREIVVGQRNSGAENVCHQYYMVRAKDRYPTLKRIVDVNPDIYGIIFCRTRHETQEVADKLMQEGYMAEALHGDLSQSQRDQVMRKFRNKSIQMLVATDVAARGVDVNDLTHVINYNLPDEIANYTHRSGRTGRAGKTGISVAIIHQRETGRIKAIEKRIRKKFERCMVPSGKEICEKQLVSQIDSIMSHEVDENLIEQYLPVIEENLASLDREDLIKRFVAYEFKRFLEYYRNAPDLNIKKEKAVKKGERRKEKDAKGRNGNSRSRFTRFFINVGKGDGIVPERLIGIINERTKVGNISIGKIELLRNFSFLEADSRFAEHVLHAFNHMIVNGKKVKIEVAQGKRPAYLDRKTEPFKYASKKSVAAGRKRKKRRM